jgi:hypothetical protein
VVRREVRFRKRPPERSNERRRGDDVSGIVVRTKALRPVEFVCPDCGIDRSGSIVDRRRWWVALGIPLVPLAVLDPMVECGTCSYRCGIGVLAIPTAAALGDLLGRALRHAIASVLRSGTSGAVRSADVARQAVAIMRAAGFDYDRFALERDVAELSDAGTTPTMSLLADEMTAHGKQALVHRLYGLAAVAGQPTRQQLDLLVRIGVALAMAAPHINGVLAVAGRDEQVSRPVAS